MFRALPGLFFALWPAIALAQTQAPPDTKPARERHRQAEKETPPPEGPWGPEEVGLTWHSPIWRGVIGTVATYSGASIELNAPHGLAAQSDGVNPPIFESLEYHNERFHAISGSLAADFDVFRLSLTGFSGRFDTHATLTRDDGVLPPQSRSLSLDGNLYGFRFGGYWPAFRYRDFLTEFSVGPTVSVGWLHQETSGIPGSLLTRDTLDILTGSFGPKASFRLMYGKFCFELDAEYVFMTGAARGWTKEFSAGIGYRF